jgi:hypothetical protein
MAAGPGKYDNLATYVREESKAEGAIVIIFGGNKGSGFSVQAQPNMLFNLPKILKDLAKEIERDIKASK